ncbi:PstS family phosphate ABC transporter substrate-binding protein [Radiobacillus sp. PE A8.2]|uniref:PstS family phosphate ABC transporter substrate-binding protein n=1 Tax=Radiobacillus sp. PE A8.2 TaxID=3380349 RepID=UPI0038902E32
MKNFKLFAIAAMLVMMIGLLAACGNGEEGNNTETENNAEQNDATNGNNAAEEPAEEEPAEEEAALEGQVIVDGSGTVYPLMAHIADQYMSEEQPEVSVQVGRAGSSAGFEKFIPGETDFSDASRPIKDEEIAGLEDNGYTFGEDILEFKLAYDGLTMVINPENDWASEMTKEEIVNMYLSGKYADDDVVMWSDVREGWPEEEIKFYGPNENHGTNEFFVENILEEQPMVETAELQQEYSTLVDLVSKDVNAIAFFGYGYYVNNQDKLQAVSVDFGDGPVAPSLETIGEDLDYAGFTRPVFTYLNATYAQEKPQVLDYAYYVLEAAPELAGENGFAPLPADVYAGYKEQLDALK